MTLLLSTFRRSANIWRPIVVSLLLLSYVVWFVDDRSKTPEPYTSDSRLLTALLTPDDVGNDWQRKRVRGSAEEEITACAEFRLFDDSELLDAARVELGQDIDGEDPRWLIQTVLVAKSETLAESRLRNADMMAQCGIRESDGQPILRIERFELPAAGDDVVAVRYHEIEPQEDFERPYVGHDVIIRSGRVIAVLFLGRFDRAPELAETVAIVNRMRERVEAYERRMTPEWHATPTAAVPTDTLPRSALDEMLPDAADVEPLLSLIDSGVYGTEGWAFDRLLPASPGFVVGEYRQFRSVGDFYEYVASCTDFETADKASLAFRRSYKLYLANDDHAYSVAAIEANQFGDESEMLVGTVVRGETDYPVAITLVRSDEVACQYMGFTVKSDPFEQVVELVERVVPPEN